MLQSFFTGLSGMLSFSKGLDNVSNNIANMNTPGYRGTDTFLRNLNTQGGEQGFGTSVEGTSTRVASGDIRQTGNETDLAISGQGMFVLRNDAGESFYTRAGQFRFNQDDILIDGVTELEVMGLSSSNNLEAIDMSELRILPAVATSEVAFSGNLSSTEDSHQVNSITVFDAAGESHELTLSLTNPVASTDTWNVEVSDIDGNVLGTGDVRFDTSTSPSTPLVGFNSFALDIELSGVIQNINFNFGDVGSLTGTTQSSGTVSTMGLDNANGNSILGVSQIKFTSDGMLELTYSNGDVKNAQQLAIASFANEAELDLASGGLYQSPNTMPAAYGRADSNGLGTINGGSIELSNVDLTLEFADLLVVQRGYQASSQVLSVADDMIEQLYNSTRG
jgi:flagellar hook protein FlgE